MKSRKDLSKNPLLARPGDPASLDQIRGFALLLLPIYEAEWERELTSPKPNWTFLLSLHLRMIQLKQGAL
jgi:hypothetical protein